uniref:Uncharacterized protein n=1 Tax=Ditylenchus dipsaci TaxID=166011 RepID=A0A915D8U2_9BILA
MEWTEDLLRQKRTNCSKDSALHRKLCTIELCLNRLCDLWHSTQPNSDFRSTTSIKRGQKNSEHNGYVRIGERLDWILMCLFLTMLTMPVLYLFVSM